MLEFFKKRKQKKLNEKLFKAVRQKNFEHVKEILKKGADPNAEEADKSTILTCAVRYGNYEVVKVLLENGADPKKGDNVYTLLFEAACLERPEIVKLLFNYHLTPEDAHFFGEPFLIYAVRECRDADKKYDNKRQMIQLFLDYHANPDIQDKSGNTALMEAVLKENVELVKMLLNYKANPDIQDKSGKTPLMVAAADHRYTEILKMLLEGNANIDIQDHKGNTALIRAAQRNRRNNLQELLEHKANPDIQNTNGETALINVAKKGDIQSVQLLLDQNANINLKDKWGNTALDIARDQRFIEIADLLETHMKEGEKQHLEKTLKKMKPAEVIEKLKDQKTYELVEKFNIWGKLVQSMSISEINAFYKEHLENKQPFEVRAQVAAIRRQKYRKEAEKE